MEKLHNNIYVHTTGDGLNVGCVVDEDGAVSIDLPLNVGEALGWRDMIQTLTPKPLRTIIYTSPDRTNSDALKALPEATVVQWTNDGLPLYIVGEMAKVGAMQADDAIASDTALRPSLPPVLAVMRSPVDATVSITVRGGTPPSSW